MDNFKTGAKEIEALDIWSLRRMLKYSAMARGAKRNGITKG